VLPFTLYKERHLVNATKVNAGLAESNGRLLLGIWRDSLHVTCGLTACTPGSAQGPTLGNEYGKTLLFYFEYYKILQSRQLTSEVDQQQNDRTTEEEEQVEKEFAQ